MEMDISLIGASVSSYDSILLCNILIYNDRSTFAEIAVFRSNVQLHSAVK